MTWFQPEYVYRRQLELMSPTTVSAGHPVTAHLDPSLRSNGKVREDHEDIEVVHLSGATPSNKMLDRVVEVIEGELYVTFLLENDIYENEPVSDEYFVYYGNLDLTNQPPRPMQAIDVWPVTITHDEGVITYTRPGEHWNEGESNVHHARANLVFHGTRVRINSAVGLDKAIMEVRIDDEDWEEVDLYSLFDGIEPVYEKLDLDPTRHELTIRVSGEANVSAIGDYVNIKSVDYRKPVVAVDLGEQMNDLVWSSSVGGA